MIKTIKKILNMLKSNINSLFMFKLTRSYNINNNPITDVQQIQGIIESTEIVMSFLSEHKYLIDEYYPTLINNEYYPTLINNEYYPTLSNN